MEAMTLVTDCRLVDVVKSKAPPHTYRTSPHYISLLKLRTCSFMEYDKKTRFIARFIVKMLQLASVNIERKQDMVNKYIL